MHPDTRNIANHMKDFGLCLLGRSIVDVTFSEMTKPFGHAMGLVQCAHAAEIIIKARIAQEHPLLIFSKLPKPDNSSLQHLDLDALIADGKTVMYSELPDLLWAATGYRVPELQRYCSFGRLRNMITHLTVPMGDLSDETLRFAFLVIEPMIVDFWGANILEFVEYYDSEPEEYVHEQLVRLGIPIRS